MMVLMKEFDVTAYDGSLQQDVGWLEFVHPESPLWASYIDVYVDYLIEEWPSVLESSSRAGVQQRYRKYLIDRVEEGGRYLVFYVENDRRVGIANLYTSCLDSVEKQGTAPEVLLHVAEFQVAHAYRRQGVGRRFFGRLCSFGQKLSCRRLSVEVDLSKVTANEFWSSTLGPPITRNGRQVYVTNITAQHSET